MTAVGGRAIVVVVIAAAAAAVAAFSFFRVYAQERAPPPHPPVRTYPRLDRTMPAPLTAYAPRGSPSPKTARVEAGAGGSMDVADILGSQIQLDTRNIRLPNPA